MQSVQLPRGHEVEDLEHLIYGSEIAHHIEHEASVRHIGPVFDGQRLKRKRQLGERGLGIESPVLIVKLYFWLTVCTYRDAIPSNWMCIGCLHWLSAVPNALDLWDDVARLDLVIGGKSILGVVFRLFQKVISHFHRPIRFSFLLEYKALGSP